MAGNRDRQRRIAREKHRIQRELNRARRQQVRKRTTIILTSVMALALILGLTLAFLPSSGSTKTTASSKATPTSTATPTSSATTAATTVAEPAHHCTYNTVTTNVARKVPAGMPIASEIGVPANASAIARPCRPAGEIRAA